MRVKQVEHLLDLLELYARDKTPLTLTELSRQLGMPKSSAFNLIDTLVARGFLYETRQRGGYFPTRRILDIASGIMDGDSVLESVRAELEKLAEEAGETALIGVRRGHEVLYVDVVESASAIRYNTRVGDSRPLYTASSGKAILMATEPEEREAIARALTYVARQKSTLMSPEELIADLDAAIRRGWSEDRAEYSHDVMGVGVPLVHGGKRFGLAVAGPLYRVRQQRAELAAMLKRTAERMQAILDGREPG